MHGGQLACKVIKLPSGSREKLHREMGILSKMPSHPNIVKLYKSTESKNNLYLFMEYCDVGDLKQFVKRRFKSGRLGEEEARYVMRDVIRGLCQMSDVCQVMHRDLKLENILVKSKHPEAAAISDFEFKIGDMGLAKGHSGDHLLYGTICGSPLYMAPEVLLNQPYNHSADIWSLGTMLYHLLTGNYPFDASTLSQLKKNVQLGVYWIPKSVRLSYEVTQFLNCCL